MHIVMFYNTDTDIVSRFKHNNPLVEMIAHKLFILIEVKAVMKVVQQ